MKTKIAKRFALLMQRIDESVEISPEERIVQLNDPQQGAYTVSLIPGKIYEPVTIADYEEIRTGENIPMHPNKFLHAYARAAGIVKDSPQWEELVQALAYDVTTHEYGPLLGNKIEDILAPQRKREPEE